MQKLLVSNKTLKISFSFKKELFDLVTKSPRYLIFFLVDEFRTPRTSLEKKFYFFILKPLVSP